MAAMLNKSHVLGVCGPIAAADDKLYIDGYAAGAKAAKPNMVVHEVYTGSYSDDSLMESCAKTYVADGYRYYPPRHSPRWVRSESPAPTTCPFLATTGQW